MVVLVTGATGFMGRHLVRELLASGHRVRALTRETSDCGYLDSHGVDVRRGSLVDGQSVSRACRDVEVVFNLAGKLGGPGAREEELRLANIAAVKTFLEVCQESTVRQFIHCSTPGVFGMVAAARESMPYRPFGLYERTKCEAEKIVLLYQANGRVPTTIVRPDFVYGPGDTHKLRLFAAIKKGLFPLIGRGDSLVHPTYVDDAMRGMMLALGNPAAYGETFNLAGPEPVTVEQLASTIAGVLGVRTRKLRVPVPAARLAALFCEAGAAVLRCKPIVTTYQVSFFSEDHTSDVTKAGQVLGYEPQVHLLDGVQRTARWYRKQGYL